jgi:integrase
MCAPWLCCQDICFQRPSCPVPTLTLPGYEPNEGNPPPPTPEGWLFANADTKRPVHGDVIQKDYLRPASEKVELLGVGWHTFRHTYRTLIDDVGTPLGVQQHLMRHADIKTTMNTYGSAFEKSRRRANSRVALVLPPAIKRQLKDRAKEVSLQNLKLETAAIQ